MSFQMRALVVTSAIALVGCSQDAAISPSITAPPRTFAINPAAACNGATMPVGECQALVAIYNSTNGAAWESSANWGVNPNPCTWYGVTCSGGATGSVKELDLGGNDLSGSLPAAVGNLPALDSLDLSWNSLSGSIPSAISNLTSLKTLRLNDNDLTGTIPTQLGALTALRVVDLRRNQLTGSIPEEIGNLINIVVLDVGDNLLTGQIPASLGNLINAYSLGLYANQLTGLMPLAFAVTGGAIASGDGHACYGRPGNAGLYMPDTPTYRAADVDGNGFICDIPFSPAEDIGEDAVDELEELVPDVLNEGQANALQSKIDNAMEKAAKGQYGAAINQMQAFLGQLSEMVTAGTLTPAQAAPFINQAESLIAIWTDALP